MAGGEGGGRALDHRVAVDDRRGDAGIGEAGDGGGELLGGKRTQRPRRVGAGAGDAGGGREGGGDLLGGAGGGATDRHAGAASEAALADRLGKKVVQVIRDRRDWLVMIGSLALQAIKKADLLGCECMMSAAKCRDACADVATLVIARIGFDDRKGMNIAAETFGRERDERGRIHAPRQAKGERYISPHPQLDRTQELFANACRGLFRRHRGRPIA